MGETVAGSLGSEPPDVLGWPLEAAEAVLAAAGLRVLRRTTAWRGDLPGGDAPGGGSVQRVLAVRPVAGAVELVVAAFAGDGPQRPGGLGEGG